MHKSYFYNAMQFVTRVLALMLLLLAFKPGMDSFSKTADSQLSCCTEACSSSSVNDNPQERNADGECGGGSCNPFQVCNACAMARLDTTIDFIPGPTACPEKGSACRSLPTRLFASDVWQPPRFV